jgi:hypothetical protein
MFRTFSPDGLNGKKLIEIGKGSLLGDGRQFYYLLLLFAILDC